MELKSWHGDRYVLIKDDCPGHGIRPDHQIIVVGIGAGPSVLFGEHDAPAFFVWFSAIR
jgi:hypothetical protein